MQGLRKIRETGQSIGVPIRVFGPETHITAVVPMALGLVDGSKMPEFDEVDEKVRKASPFFLSLAGGSRFCRVAQRFDQSII